MILAKSQAGGCNKRYPNKTTYSGKPFDGSVRNMAGYKLGNVRRNGIFNNRTNFANE